MAGQPNQIEAIIAGRRKLDELASSLAPDIRSRKLDCRDNPSLQAIAESIAAANDCQSLVDILAYSSTALRIPATAPPTGTEDITLPSFDDIAPSLATDELKIQVNGLRDSGLDLNELDEVLLVDHPDEELYNDDLKRNDYIAWLEKVGVFRLQCLHRQASIAIADSDLSLSQKQIDTYAVSALRRVAASTMTSIHDQCWKEAQLSFNHLLGLKGDVDNDIIKPGHTVRCDIGLDEWEGRFGLGIAIQTSVTVALYYDISSDEISTIVPQSKSNSTSLLGDISIKVCHRQALDDIDAIGGEIRSHVMDHTNSEIQILFTNRSDECSAAEVRGVPLSQVARQVPLDLTDVPVGDMEHAGEVSVDKMLTNSDQLHFLSGDGLMKVPFSPLSSLESITNISCSDSHVLCLSSLGVVYSKGNNADGQLGHGNQISSENFQAIEWFLGKSGGGCRIRQVSAGSHHSAAVDSDGLLYSWGKKTLCGHTGTASSAVNEPKLVESLTSVLQVSCGGSFSLAIVQICEGEVKAHKRRSLFAWGLTESGRCGTGARSKKTPAYQLRPLRITSLKNEDITSVSAGPRHSLAVTSTGEVFAWGRNNEGQCGFGVEDSREVSAVDETIWEPRKVAAFGKECDTSTTIVSVSAGKSTSAAIDINGCPWTWGGGGGDYGDVLLGRGGDTGRESCGFISDEGVLETLPIAGRPLTEIQMLSGCLSLPTWSIPRPIKALEASVIVKIAITENLGTAISKEGELYSWGTSTSEVHGARRTIATPTLLAPNKYSNLASSSGSSFAIANGHRLSRVGLHLLNQCEMHNGLGSLGAPDCCIVASNGKRLYCHKAVLACRSPELERMLQDEDLVNSNQSVTELLLPMVYEVTQGLLQYIYTDSLYASQVGVPYILLGLIEAGCQLQLPNLVCFCKKYINDSVSMEDFECPASIDKDVPPSLSVDLRGLLEKGGEKWADVTIITAEGETIKAHAFILCSRSEYFRGLIKESKENARSVAIPEIVLTESYDEIVRTLLFCYSDEVVLLSDHEMIMKDLEIAQKYGVSDLQRRLESLLEITEDNAAHVLAVALRTKSKRLEAEAIRVLSSNLKPGCIDDHGTSTASVHAIFDRIKETDVYSVIPRARLKAALASMKAANECLIKRTRKQEEESMRGNEALPFSAMAGFVGSLIGYLLLSSIAGGHMNMVIVMNIIFLLLALRLVLGQK